MQSLRYSLAFIYRLFLPVILLGAVAQAQPLVMEGQEVQLFNRVERSALPYQGRMTRPPVFLEISDEWLTGVRYYQPEAWTLMLPGEQGELVLDLHRFEVLAPDFKLTLANNRLLGANQPICYKGVLRGAPESQAVITINIAGEHLYCSGVIMTPERTYNLGRENLSEPTPVYLLTETGQYAKPVAFRCHTQDAQGMDLAAPARSTATGCKAVRVFMECDHQLFIDNGRSATATMSFMTSLFAPVAAIYAAEDIRLELAEVFVWDTPDPYRGIESSSDVLNAYEARNPLSGRSADLAHLVSSQNFNRGGIAYLDRLCKPNRQFNIGFSEIFTTFRELPIYSWSVGVLAHELGHNLGSPHTHNCNWPGGAIDGCAPTFDASLAEGTCALPPLPVKGTVMSYCHLLQNVGIDLTLGFGPLPGALIRDRVAKGTCLAARSCLCPAPRDVVITELGAQIQINWSTADATITSLRIEIFNATTGQFQLVKEASSLPTTIDTPTGEVVYRFTAACSDGAANSATRRFRATGVVQEFVFPGDVTNDGVVDEFDFFFAAAAIGKSGPARAERGIQFRSYVAPADWGTSSNFRGRVINNKFIDANGDGVINLDDLSVTIIHQGKTR